MIEINIFSLVVTALVAIGLIGAQAALSRKNFVLTVSSPENLTKDGYTRDVVEALFFNEIEWVARTRSVVTVPHIESSREKGVVSAVAEMLHMGELSIAMQQAIGKPPYRVWANVVNESGKTHVLVYGNSARGDFQREVTSDGDMRTLVRAAAHAAVRAIDPYLIALHEFELGQNLAGVETAITEELTRPRALIPPLQQAALYNLRGLVLLEKNDKQGALAAFDAAYAAEPEFAIARINRAFTLITLNRPAQAMATAKEVLDSPAGKKIGEVVVAARLIVAMVKWVQGDSAGAEAEFLAAIEEAPRNLAPIIYWLRVLNEQGGRDPAAEKLLATAAAKALSIQNREMATSGLNSEIAMLYFSMNRADGTVARRVVLRPARPNPGDESGRTRPATPD
jgi:hypothetical protein